MSSMQAGALTMVLLFAAWMCVVRALRRAPRSVAAARRAMAAGAADPAVHDIADMAAAVPARWVAHRHEDDLALLGLTAADVATRMVTTAALMAVVVGLGTATLAAVGVLPVITVVVAPIAGVAAGWTVQRGLAADAARRRRDFRRAANDFVQLVAIGLTTDQSVEESIRFALDVGGGEGFDELRRDVAAAPLRGVPVWDAIDQVGRRVGVRELCEFAASIERQGTQGVAIGDTVASLAAGMRAKALDELERAADKANANLSGPTIGFVVATIVFLAFPLAQRITDAFGG